METFLLAALNNRKKIKETLSNNEFIVFAGRKEAYRSGDCTYQFRQDSNFLYSAGINIPDLIFILTKTQEYLFIPKFDQKHFVWNPSGLTISGAKKNFKINKVFYQNKFNAILKTLTKKHKICLTDKTKVKNLKSISNQVLYQPKRYEKTMNLMRSQKNIHEIELMKHSALFASKAIVNAISKVRNGMHEYQLQGILENFLFMNNVRATAFPTIVASGINSSILHYNLNNSVLKNGNLCLIDFGAEYMGYASDITRTFPVSKKFTSIQRDIYSIVLKAQKECINIIRAGIKISKVQEHAVKIISKELLNLGLFKVSLEKIISTGSYSIFYPHGISHMLGLDVHDVFIKPRKKKNTLNLRADIILEENFLITVEPGIYFNKLILTNSAIRKKYKNTINWNETNKFLDFGGIRIEDDVWIQKNGCKILTDVPKEIIDIENLKR